MKSVLMVLVIVFSASTGDVLMKRALTQAGEVRFGKILKVAFRVLTNHNFLISLFFMTLGFFAFLSLLSWENVSFIIPATSLEYVLSTLGARFILHENISRLRWAGAVFVCIGVGLISLK